MPATIANCGISPGTSVTIGSNVVYTKGGVQAGCEGEIAFATVDQLSAPFAARIVNKQLVLKGTSAEVTAAIIADVWGETTGASPLDIGVPTLVTPPTLAVGAVFAGGTYAITAAYASDFGDMSADESDVSTLAFTFKGIVAGGAAAQGSWTDD